MWQTTAKLLIRNYFIIFLILFPSFVFAETISSNNFSYSVNPVLFKEDEKGLYQLELIQPYSFDPKTIRKSMASLAYQKKVVSWSKRKRVFSTSSIKYLAPLIVKQFTTVNNNQTLVFWVREKSGKLLLKGDTFFTAGGLHWRLTFLYGKQRQVADFSVFGDSVRLTPLRSQVYKDKKRYKNLTEYYTNWIIFKGIHPVSSRIISLRSAEKKSPPTVPTSLDVKRRLKILEDLKKEGMIDDREYKRKREEIMKSF